MTGASALAGKCGTDVQVERFADGAGFFGAVEDGDLLDRFRDGGEQALDRERTVQVDLDHADFFAAGDQEVDGLLDRFADRAHGR